MGQGGRRFALGLTVGAVVCTTGQCSALAATGFVPAETLGAAGTAQSVVQTAMAPNGFAIAGWGERLSGGQSAIEVATRPPGGPWSSAQQLELGATPKSPRFPVSVAVDAAGDAAIAWDDQASMSSDNALVSTRAASQQSFGAPQTLTGATDPVVGIDGSGRVTMIDQDQASQTEFARTWQAGAPVPALPVTNLATGCGSAFPASLAVAPGGDAIVGMTCGTATSGGAMFARRTGGTWQPTVTLASNTTSGNCMTSFTEDSAQQTAVAIDGQGDPAGVLIEDVINGCAPASTDAYTLMLVLPGVAGLHVVATVDTASSASFGFGTELVTPNVAIGDRSEIVSWSRSTFTPPNAVGDVRQYDSAGQPAGAAQTLVTETGGIAAPIGLAVGSSGTALAVLPSADGTGLQAAVRPPGGAFALTPLASNATAGSVAIDDAGDGVAAYAPTATGATGALARGFDATAPVISSASIPTAATVGQAATFSAAATDFWGPLTLSWSFGDGTAATGAAVSHTFTRPGSRSVTVTATDAVGNAAGQSGTTAAVAPAVAASRPEVSNVSVTHSTFRVGSAPTPIVARTGRRKPRAPVGTTFVFTLSEAAGVAIQVTHREPGRRSGHACMRPTKQLRTHRRCTRSVVIGTLRRVGIRGVNRVTFSGRFAHTPLHLGSYHATLTATALGLASLPRKLSFRIVR